MAQVAQDLAVVVVLGVDHHLCHLWLRQGEHPHALLHCVPADVQGGRHRDLLLSEYLPLVLLVELGVHLGDLLETHASGRRYL